MEAKKTKLPIADLVEDPLNAEAFDDGDQAALARSISEDGFFGEVAVYPSGDGKYVIESGHRRVRAAKEAGLETIDASVGEPPKDDLERRKRLVRWNLHSRPSNPMATARLVEFQKKTYAMENEARAAAGLKPLPVLERVAADLECSVANVSKYSNLTRLVPELQRLVENGACSWAPTSKAASLTARQQRALAGRISAAAKLGGDVTGAWIESEIYEMSLCSLSDDEERPRPAVLPEEGFDGDAVAEALAGNRKASRRVRRKDGAKGAAKALAYLKDAVGDGSFIAKGAEGYVLDAVEEMVEIGTKFLEERGRRRSAGASPRPRGEVSGAREGAEGGSGWGAS